MFFVSPLKISGGIQGWLAFLYIFCPLEIALKWLHLFTWNTSSFVPYWERTLTPKVGTLRFTLIALDRKGGKNWPLKCCKTLHSGCENEPIVFGSLVVVDVDVVYGWRGFSHTMIWMASINHSSLVFLPRSKLFCCLVG